MASPQIRLTASEMASLWNAYINLTHNCCMLEYMISKAEDQDVMNVLQTTYQYVLESKKNCITLLQGDSVPVPIGFSSEDVDTHAPRLFSDSFSLLYIKNLSRVMLSACGIMFTMCTRKDIRDYFKKCLNDAAVIFDQVSDVLLEKGIYTRAPFIEPPVKNDFIENKDYLSGINFLDSQRYLNSIEISHIFSNIEANVIGKTLTQAFVQTADLEEVRNFMKKASGMCEKVINSLTKFLTSSDLPSPMPSETQVYSSTQPAFSDRLMMYEIGVLTAAGISDYATASAASFRNDVVSHYMDLFTDTSSLAKKAENILIKNHWLEQPPQQEKVEK